MQDSCLHAMVDFFVVQADGQFVGEQRGLSLLPDAVLSPLASPLIIFQVIVGELWVMKHHGDQSRQKPAEPLEKPPCWQQGPEQSSLLSPSRPFSPPELPREAVYCSTCPPRTKRQVPKYGTPKGHSKGGH